MQGFLPGDLQPEAAQAGQHLGRSRKRASAGRKHCFFQKASLRGRKAAEQRKEELGLKKGFVFKVEGSTDTPG